MKKAVTALVLAGLCAVPLAALVPLGGGMSSDRADAEVTRKKTKKRTTVAAKPTPAPTPTTAASPAPPPVPVVTIDPQSFEGRILAAHNAERKLLGIAPLVWSTKLAGQAKSWADNLAAKGLFEHSSNRDNAGENLWAGTSGYYGPEAMIGAFIGEKQYFRPGKFPDVSSTGRWSDVGHYTQLIWRGTRELGCAKATGNGRDVLVCRYYPAGNVIGDRVP